jgi:FAD synthase
VEAHLLDFEGDLYDEHAKVRFVELACAEKNASSAWKALVEQIGRDCDEAARLRCHATERRSGAMTFRVTPRRI